MFAQITLIDGKGEQVHIQINGGSITKHGEHPVASIDTINSKQRYIFAASGGDEIDEQQRMAILKVTRTYHDAVLDVLGHKGLYAERIDYGDV